jgi:hypothetical protein
VVESVVEFSRYGFVSMLVLRVNNRSGWDGDRDYGERQQQTVPLEFLSKHDRHPSSPAFLQQKRILEGIDLIITDNQS